MLTGAFWALWSLRNSLWSAVRSGLKVSARGSADVPHTERDLPMGAVLICIALFVVPLFFLYYLVVGTIGVALAMAVIMIVAGFLFSSVSGYMAGLVGSSNNPVSGITICTILFASLVLMWMVGGNSSIGAVAVVFIGAVVCNAAAVAGDNLQDLKAGQLVGATPWRQQVMLCVGVVASAAVMAPVMNVLLFAYGIGEPAHAGVKALPAPQANLVRSVAEGMFGGTLPVGMIALGALIGALIIIFDLYLKRVGSRWSAPVLAVAVGIYLPLDVSTPILAGGIVAEMVARWHTARGAGDDHELLKQNGMLFAAGLITGEALIGIFIAMCIWISKNPDVLAVASELPGGKWWAALLLLGMCYWIYRAGTPRRAV
jgi:putative OPT family oligopeptide transporter